MPHEIRSFAPRAVLLHAPCVPRAAPRCPCGCVGCWRCTRAGCARAGSARALSGRRELPAGLWAPGGISGRESSDSFLNTAGWGETFESGHSESLPVALFRFACHVRLHFIFYFFFPPLKSSPTDGFSPLLSLPPFPHCLQPPCARLAGRLAALPGCDGPRALRRGSRLRPAARRPPVSPGTEGRDMPAAAAPPAPAPPAPAAAATAPSPEALGTWDGAARPGEGAIVPPRPGAVGARRGSAGSGALSAPGAGGREVWGTRVRIPGFESPGCSGAREAALWLRPPLTAPALVLQRWERGPQRFDLGSTLGLICS